MLYIVTNMFYL